MNGIENYPAAGEDFLENVIFKVSQTHFSKDFYPKGGGGTQVNIVKKMSYIWVKNVVVFINQRAIFPVSEARFKLSLFLFFLLFLLKFERYVVDISCCVTQLTVCI